MNEERIVILRERDLETINRALAYYGAPNPPPSKKTLAAKIAAALQGDGGVTDDAVGRMARAIWEDDCRRESIPGVVGSDFDQDEFLREDYRSNALAALAALQLTTPSEPETTNPVGATSGSAPKPLDAENPSA